tara:strand:- start:73704 stop:73931 length:228 start_codon:yes stop_codon:yes gene_type:complete
MKHIKQVNEWLTASGEASDEFNSKEEFQDSVNELSFLNSEFNNKLETASNESIDQLLPELIDAIADLHRILDKIN